MNLKNPMIRGTIFLMFAGLFSRFLGFFYRIFLANTIGAEGMGIYQLIFPVYGICFALCASGIETAVSKLTAEKYALGKPDQALNLLKTALLLTLFLAVSCSTILYRYAEIISELFLKENRCTPLLRILALTIPFGTCQSCICGYYFGKHRASIPSAAQIIEQSIRIFSTMLICRIYKSNEINISPAIAVIGLTLGEISSLLFTVTCFSFHPPKANTKHSFSIFNNLKEISVMAAPLTLSRICVTLLAGLEAALIPLSLRSYGMTSASALELYGTLTGMSLPFIMFPNALTSSVSLMLLPKISELQARKQYQKLSDAIRNTFFYGFLLGIVCMLFFLIFGKRIGELFFHNETAGTFITILAWLCPFIYLNGTLTSILNGLGQTNITFFNGVFSFFLRILIILSVIPHKGIYGYLIALLAGQMFMTISTSTALINSIRSHKKSPKADFI